mmetsp:Transcript_83517/g.190500  ORF Transcript_83517/g.190500 Transcript_83517/m.190500 type:complete len:962 (+) Transcript_83517:80-2965(+)
MGLRKDFLLKNLLSKYVRGPWNSKKIHAQWAQGELTFDDLELEPAAIQELLVDVVPLLFEVVEASCDQVTVKVPWQKVTTRNTVVFISKLRVKVRFHTLSDESWMTKVDQLLETAHKRYAEQVEAGPGGLSSMNQMQQRILEGIQLTIGSCILDILVDDPRFMPDTTELSEAWTHAFTVSVAGIHVCPCGPDGQGVDDLRRAATLNPHSMRLDTHKLVTVKSLTLVPPASWHDKPCCSSARWDWLPLSLYCRIEKDFPSDGSSLCPFAVRGILQWRLPNVEVETCECRLKAVLAFYTEVLDGQGKLRAVRVGVERPLKTGVGPETPLQSPASSKPADPDEFDCSKRSRALARGKDSNPSTDVCDDKLPVAPEQVEIPPESTFHSAAAESEQDQGGVRFEDAEQEEQAEEASHGVELQTHAQADTQQMSSTSPDEEAVEQHEGESFEEMSSEGSDSDADMVSLPEEDWFSMAPASDHGADSQPGGTGPEQSTYMKYFGRKFEKLASSLSSSGSRGPKGDLFTDWTDNADICIKRVRLVVHPSAEAVEASPAPIIVQMRNVDIQVDAVIGLTSAEIKCLAKMMRSAVSASGKPAGVVSLARSIVTIPTFDIAYGEVLLAKPSASRRAGACAVVELASKETLPRMCTRKSGESTKCWPIQAKLVGVAVLLPHVGWEVVERLWTRITPSLTNTTFRPQDGGWPSDFIAVEAKEVFLMEEDHPDDIEDPANAPLARWPFQWHVERARLTSRSHVFELQDPMTQAGVVEEVHTQEDVQGHTVASLPIVCPECEARKDEPRPEAQTLSSLQDVETVPVPKELFLDLVNVKVELNHRTAEHRALAEEVQRLYVSLAEKTRLLSLEPPKASIVEGFLGGFKNAHIHTPPPTPLDAQVAHLTVQLEDSRRRISSLQAEQQRTQDELRELKEIHRQDIETYLAAACRLSAVRKPARPAVPPARCQSGELATR